MNSSGAHPGASAPSEAASGAVQAGSLSAPPPQASRARRWLVSYPRAIPVAIFLAIAAITALSVFAIESNARAREKAQMREYAQSIASALDRRGTSFSSYLRAGAALFSSLEEVSPRTFRQFVSELRIDLDYRGAEGIGWIAVEDAQAAAGGQGKRATVRYIWPDTERNRRAIGFDMYSEDVRAAALEEARRTVRPTASGRIVLAQEGVGTAPGFLIVMPVFAGDPTMRDSERSLSGFVYSPFDADQFLSSAIDQAAPADLGVRLYDGDARTDNLLVAHSSGARQVQRMEQPVTIANRELLLVVEAAEAQALAPLSMVTLLFGLAVASLLMLLARLLTQQAFEDQARLAFFEEQHSIRNSLSRELNHRVKNTLANVLSILSLTRRRSTSLDDFADSLEGRIRALSATHDLLTGTDWSTTPIEAVVDAELQHFRSLSDEAVTIEGPPAQLAPNDALSFGLAIHELGTNAAKYGALSVPGGRVSIRWKLIGERLAEVEWRETGGPPVAETRKRGFGTELIEKIVAHELRHKVTLDFEPDGVRCVMRVPIRRRGDFRIRDGAPRAKQP
ncbi:CHASE HWE-family sensor histidine kinase [Erythrobacter litoralis]|uniref:histidine kinase n=1 Tax=Erythrobacter litoralis TaxID=39960 RepID=A0A074MHS9_9SPHN|nr:HWE-family sensor histidine kinase GsrP [Erythrobacter litoralis]AOL22564.1 CHASE HWE-family sensor histidine kinase [Erythrobacter litoralis]KEO92380.1 histidine kinase [Erythrobacter litoralis]